MNSKTRMQLAMTGQKPDRTPLMCQLALGHIYKNAGLGPVDYWFTPEGLAEGYIRMAEKYHFDGILLSLWYGKDPAEAANVVSVEEHPDGHLVSFKDGTKLICPLDDDPRPLEQQNKPLTEISIFDVDPETVRMYNSEADLPAHFANITQICIDKKGSELSIHGEVATAFEVFLTRMGSYENGLMALMDDPDRCKAVMDAMNQDVIICSLKQCKMGIDAFKLSSPFAGAGFISRDMYKEFVLPYERDLIAEVHKFGIPTYIHTCGAIGDRLDLMLETGTDGLECLDPPPIGTVDLAQAVDKIGDKIFIKGNLDSVNELTGHSVEEVKQIARKRIEIGKKAKGYILSSACSISPKTPPENILALYDVVME